MVDESASTMEKFLTFVLGNEFFALDICSVREILDMTGITRIPQSPPFMRGVVNVRGNAVPVIDMRMKFGLGRIETTLNTRIVIIEIARDQDVTVIGAIADSVKEVLELETGKIDPPPKIGTRIKADFIRGIGKHNEKFILILDIGKVFSHEELATMAGADASLQAETQTAVAA